MDLMGCGQTTGGKEGGDYCAEGGFEADDGEAVWHRGSRSWIRNRPLRNGRRSPHRGGSGSFAALPAFLGVLDELGPVQPDSALPPPVELSQVQPGPALALPELAPVQALCGREVCP
jgi:hypothetical protein